jgi:hypothetical protein
MEVTECHAAAGSRISARMACGVKGFRLHLLLNNTGPEPLLRQRNAERRAATERPNSNETRSARPFQQRLGGGVSILTSSVSCELGRRSPAPEPVQRA